MKVLIFGATGFIGKNLVNKLLVDRHEVHIITRNKSKAEHIFPKTVIVHEHRFTDRQKLATIINGKNAVINLTGENLSAKIWNESFKQKIYNSRIETTKKITEAIQSVRSKPEVFIQGSAIGYYGNNPLEELTEYSPSGTGFLAKTVQDWETESLPVYDLNVRLVIVRTGIVLSRAGGVFPLQLLPFRFFLGGHFGDGEQWISWIHIDDQVRAIIHLLTHKFSLGIYNLTSPEPVLQKDYFKAIGATFHSPSWFHKPSKILKTLLGEMAEELILSGQRVMPHRLQNENFDFKFPTLITALSNLKNA